MGGRHLILMLALTVATLASVTWTQPGPRAQGQANAPNQTAGRIVGMIKSKSGLGFTVSLSVPGTDKPIKYESVDYLDDGGKFLLENIPEGTYRLDISSMPGLGCGILPWSKVISVHVGETARVKAKIKVSRAARCE